MELIGEKEDLGIISLLMLIDAMLWLELFWERNMITGSRAET